MTSNLKALQALRLIYSARKTEGGTKTESPLVAQPTPYYPPARANLKKGGGGAEGAGGGRGDNGRAVKTGYILAAER